MKFVEKVGRTVDDAITEALIELGLTSDQVEVEVLESGSKGILGFFGKEAKVRVSKKFDPLGVAETFLDDVFDKMGLIVEKEMNLTEDNILNITLSGENMGVIIGKRGSTLDSLQYLVSLVVNKSCDERVKVKMDSENYRQRRREALESLAHNLAKKVKATNRKVTLEPMNPFERRIIHSTLQNDRFVSTHSEGQDPYRRVVILPSRNRNKDRKKPS